MACQSRCHGWVATLVAPESLIHGRFRRVGVVGRGSFGRVLQVFDVQANEPRALKVVPHGPHEGTLLDEFEQLARLRHPSLPRVYEVGRSREVIDEIGIGSPFLVAEWIAGTRSDGHSWSGDGKALWTLLADLTGALATIHAAGLVHADVAPQNVLVETSASPRSTSTALSSLAEVSTSTFCGATSACTNPAA